MFSKNITPLTPKLPKVKSQTCCALVFHQVKDNVLVTHHSVKDQVIQAGELVDIDQVRKLVQGYSEHEGNVLLPGNVLIYTDQRLVWFSKSCYRMMYFRQHRTHFNVWWPALLWMVEKSSRELYVFALASHQRPGPKTRLYHAPLMNVYEQGVLCQGTAPLPERLALDTIPEIEATLFDSNFTDVKVDFPGHLYWESNNAHIKWWRQKSNDKVKVKVSELTFYRRLGELL